MKFLSDCKPTIQESTSDDEKIKELNRTLVESAITAFKATFPEKKTPPFAKTWWNPELSNSKHMLSIHFNAWRDEGFPKETNNIFFNRYLLARKNFRKAIKAAQNKLVFDKCTKINSLKKTDSRQFWQNMRKLKDPSLKRPYTINNKRTNEDITREFADHFNTLLNHPRGNASHSKPLPESSQETFSVNTTDVMDAISQLKTNKSNDFFGVLAEHVLHAENGELINHLTTIFDNTFKNHNTPHSLSVAILIPLVKSYRKSLESPNNYRGISLIPIFTKILEYIILKKCPALTESHQSQFGFKTNSSTLHAEFLINETVNYYNKNGSTIYMCSLDAEKAFDSCNWSILFKKLYYEKKVPLPVVNVLKSMYSNGTYQVLYNGKRSYSFTASQGVFQGSILSPHLYNSYTEELLKMVESSTMEGTSLHGIFTGMVAYADDIILLSPTLTGIQSLINKCTQYFNTTAITLNVDKTEFITSGSRIPTNTFIELNYHQIHPQEKLKHLGFMWNTKKNHLATLNDANIKERTSKFWSVIHSLIKGGVRFCNPETITELYKTLAVPTLVYGLELPHLSETQLKELDKEGRKALKFLFNLSRHSRNYLNVIFNLDHISTIITNNKLKLLSRLMNNPSTQHIILHTLKSTISHQSIIQDCLDIARRNEMNIFDILLNVKRPKIESIHSTIPEEVKQEILNCLSFWNVGEQRQRFKALMEDKIPQVQV